MANSRADDPAERLIRLVESAVDQQVQSQIFFRQLALHLAKQSTADFGRQPAGATDGARAVQEFLEHETAQGRLRKGEINAEGSGLDVRALVHSCLHQSVCSRNRNELGDVPQCVRAITLIQAIGARVPQRPPMTYELQPGLVDGSAPACVLRVRPAALADLEPLDPRAFAR